MCPKERKSPAYSKTNSLWSDSKRIEKIDERVHSTNGTSWNWTLNDDGGALVIVSDAVLGSASAVTLTYKAQGQIWMSNHRMKSTIPSNHQLGSVGNITSGSPSPHPGRCAAPHGWWGGHPAGRGQPARGRANCGGQHCCDRDLLSIDLTWAGLRQTDVKSRFNFHLSLNAYDKLYFTPSRTPCTSVHVFQGLLRLFRRLKLNVGVAFGQVWVDTVHWHVDHLDLAIDGEDLLNVVLQEQPAHIASDGVATCQYHAMRNEFMCNIKMY